MNIDELFYKPHIEPTREYRSEGVILHEEPVNTSVPEEREKSRTEQVIERNEKTVEQLLRIRKITPLLPPGIVETVNRILDTVIVQGWVDNTKLKEINDQEEENKKQEENTVVYDHSHHEIPSDTDSEGDSYVWPELDSSGFVFILEKNKDIWDLAYDQYLEDSSLMRESFSDSFNQVLEPYVYQLITALDEVGLDTPESLNFEYEGETVTGIKEDDRYLSDLIARNQDVLEEGCDLFNQLYDLNTTNTVLSSFDIVSQERVRYLKTKYNEAAAQNYLAMYDKNLLASVRDQFEEKYVQARSDAYKFLFGAVSLSADMLQLHLANNLAKCSLLKKGVNIFAKKEYENEAYSNSTEIPAKGSSDHTDENKATDTNKPENPDETKPDTKDDTKTTQDKTAQAAAGGTHTKNGTVKTDAAAKNKDMKQGEGKP